ncbi:hypothetical protein Hanom_Chr02g00099261 [Helianthus anomalus]
MLTSISFLFCRNHELPLSWPASKEFSIYESEVTQSKVTPVINYLENFKISESLLLMNFYTLSSKVVKSFLSNNGHHLPFQLTHE